MEENFYDLSSFAARDHTLEGLSLLDTIKQVKPNILIGLSACGGLFNQVKANKKTATHFLTMKSFIFH